MDKNQKIGFILILLTFLVFTLVNKPPKELVENQDRARDSIEMVKKAALAQNKSSDTSKFANIAKDTNQMAAAVNTFGTAARMLLGKEEIVSLENEDIKIDFSNKGGKIIKAELKKYKKSLTPDTKEVDKLPLLLLEDPKNKFEYTLPLGINGAAISSNDIYFDIAKNDNSIIFSSHGDGKIFKQKYSLADKGHFLDYVIEANGLGEKLSLNWVNYLDWIEPGKLYEKTYSSVYFNTADSDDADYCNCSKNDEKKLDQKINWISHSNQFFNSTLLSTQRKFNKADLSIEVMEEADEDMKKITSIIEVPIEGGENKMKFYIGPNTYESLSSLNVHLQEIIPFGASIFGSINRWVIRPSFDFMSTFISSKGWVIILLIFIIKMLLYPLLYKMLLSQAKMGALKPELALLKEKHKDDLQKQQVETMKIYQEFGVSPFSGCFPMLLQMPIWIALYRFFPASITFRQEGFLWANDLSTFDPFFKLPFAIPFMGDHISLFTLLWAVSTLVYTYYSMKNVDMSANPAMKYVQYFMPLIFLGFFNNYASGLTCYMFFSNVINILQTIFTKAFIFDDEKIRRELDIKKSIPKKKKGFAAKMEDLMKQQQQVQEQKKKQAKK